MLNTDICLRFDIPEGNVPNCCTNTDQNCRGVTARCDSSEAVRPAAFNAFEDFRNPGGNRQTRNDPFYRAYETAWKIATENGYPEGSLHELADTCEAPTVTPTKSSSPSLISPSPSASVTISSSPSTEDTTPCMTQDTYDDIQTNIAEMARVVSSLPSSSFIIFLNTFWHQVTNSNSFRSFFINCYPAAAKLTTDPKRW